MKIVNIFRVQWIKKVVFVYLFVYFKCRIESTHWALKRLLQNSLGNLCSVWKAMNNMIMLQHTKVKASFETSTHMVGHVFKVTLFKKLLGMILRYALDCCWVWMCKLCWHWQFSLWICNENYSRCSMCMWARYVVGTIPLDTIHMFWWRLSFLDQGLSKPEVSITEEMKNISKLFEELDVCAKVTIKCKLRDIAYPDLNSICAPPEKVKTKGA